MSCAVLESDCYVDSWQPKTLADLGNPELSLDPKEFLQALPKSVIRNGNVIEIRSNVAQMLHGATPDERPDVFVVPTPGV